MTIDAPYTCCWAWVLVFGHRAFFVAQDSKTVAQDSNPVFSAFHRIGILCHGPGWAWLALGVAIGLGILAKYTMVLWIPSAALFLLWSKEHRPILRKPGFWVACGIAGVCCLPILWWNWHNGWVTLRHVGGQAGMASEKPPIIWAGPLKYVGGQIGVLFGFWFVVWRWPCIGIARRMKPIRIADICGSCPCRSFYSSAPSA